MPNDNQNKPSSFLQVPNFSAVIPRAEFVRKLGAEIGRTTRERMGYKAGPSFDQVVIELRRLVRLLRETLVSVEPRAAFRRVLGQQIHQQALQVRVRQQKRLRWLVIGSAVGSVVSFLGVLLAILLRQRGQGRVRRHEKIVGAI